MAQPPQSDELLWVLSLAAALGGSLSQLGVALILRTAKSRSEVVGYIIVQFFASGFSTIIFSEAFHIKQTTAAAMGGLLGIVPVLVSLRISLRTIAKRYDLEAGNDIETLGLPPGQTTTPQEAKDA